MENSKKLEDTKQSVKMLNAIIELVNMGLYPGQFSTDITVCKDFLLTIRKNVENDIKELENAESKAAN